MKVENVKEYMSSIFQNYCSEIESLLPSQSTAAKVKKRKTKRNIKKVSFCDEVPQCHTSVTAELLPQASHITSTTNGLSE